MVAAGNVDLVTQPRCGSRSPPSFLLSHFLSTVSPTVHLSNRTHSQFPTTLSLGNMLAVLAQLPAATFERMHSHDVFMI